MRHRIPRYASIALGAALVAVTFQNCGKAGFEGEGQGASKITTSSTDPYPFAFQATFDQISYNSCFGAGAQKPGFFSIMAGAYENGGVRIHPDFFTAVRTSGKIKPVYPATTISELQIKRELASAGNSDAAVPYVALRTRGQPQQVRVPTKNGQAVSAVEGVDFVAMLGDLTDDRWMDPLVKKEVGGMTSTFFELAPSSQRNFEAKVGYSDTEQNAEGLRNDLSQYGRLSLTYRVQSGQGDASMARPVGGPGVATDWNKVYGRGYDLTFERAPVPYTSMYISNGMSYVPNQFTSSNILTDVKEIDLANVSTVTGTWTCSPARRYLVVRGSDRDSYCPTDPYAYMLYGSPAVASRTGAPALPALTAAEYRRELEIMRRHLKAEYWDISVQFRCAVPKALSTGTGGECYPTEKLSNGTESAIEYDQTQPCYRGIAGINYGGPPPLKRCAHYVSVCTRN